MTQKFKIEWVIRDSNGTIKMVASGYLANSSIIIAEHMALRDDVLVVKNNGFLELDIERDSKVIIDCYSKKKNISSSIILLMKDIWKLSQNLNIHKCNHIYRKANRTAYCLDKNVFALLIIIFGGQTFQEIF